jgi:hypothetical protein
MSTFGKKSLVWWDYHDKSRDNIRRFSSTDKETQIEILKKWYPIGFRLKEYVFTHRIWEVHGYVKTLSGWNLELRSILPNEDIYMDKHPLMLEPLKEDEIKLKRDIKLEKLFK